eukprot:241407-Pyramimonas_sp.AAC.1
MARSCRRRKILNATARRRLRLSPMLTFLLSFRNTDRGSRVKSLACRERKGTSSSAHRSPGQNFTAGVH